MREKKNQYLQYAKEHGEEVVEESLVMEATKSLNKKKLLLHSCCGPCSSAVIERLYNEFDITIFFYNPNISNIDEYSKRLQAQREIIDYFNKKYKGQAITLIEGQYDNEDFLNSVKEYTNEPEGGKRCSSCFEYRLKETAAVASELDFHLFATTLTISPHKNYSIISQIGNKIAFEFDVEFLDIDFKKKDGYKRSIEISKQCNLYRQNYCGCIYSQHQ